MIQKLGKYAIVEKLGEGAMGAVYKAYDEILDRYVAVKTMAEDIKWDPELKLRFYREARSAASLHHPNIVTIHDLGEEGKITYIVMELLQGKDLRDIIKDKTPLSIEKKLSILAQVCEGLSHAHLAGIIHRDIKPGNIHFSATGNVKIVDFGIARIPSSDLTRSGVRLGTPIYMSPEQIRGETYDERSDMFSTGIVFYELLTYVHPFRDKNIAKTLDNIMFQNHFPFTEQCPDAPPGLWTIISTGIAKEPAKRYPSMADMGRACRNLLVDMNVTSQRMAAELSNVLPRLRQVAFRPDAPPRALAMFQEAERLLGQEEKSDQASLRRLLAGLAEESLSPQAPTAAPPRRDERPPEPMHPMPPSPPPSPTPGEIRGREMFQAGQGLLKEDRLEEALASLRQAMELLGQREEILQALTEVNRRIEERKRARSASLLEGARRSLESRQYTAAIETLNAVLQLDPDHPEAVEMRRRAVAETEAERARQARKLEGEREKTSGLKLLQEGKFRDSLVALKRAAELLGEDPTIQRARQQAEEQVRVEELGRMIQTEMAEAGQLLRSDALDKARARVVHVLELSPGNPEAADLLARIDQAREQKRKAAEISDLLFQSRDNLSRQDFETAYARARKALELDSSNADAGGMLRAIDQAQEAKKRQDQIEAALVRGREALERQDFAAASACCNEALAIDANHTAARTLLGSIGRAQERKRRDDEVSHLLSEGQRAFLRDDLAEAASCARQALEIDPQHTKVNDLLRRIEDTREKRKREEIAALVAQGRQALGRGELQQAADLGQKALGLDLESIEARNFLASIEQAQEARRQDEIAALLARGRQLLEQGEFAEAGRQAEAVLAMEPKNKEAGTLVKDIKRESRTREKLQANERKRLEKEARRLEKEARAPQVPEDMDGTVRLEKPAGRGSLKIVLWVGGIVILIALAAVIVWQLPRSQQAPYDPSAQLASAQASLERGLPDEAMATAQKVLDASPGNPKAQEIITAARQQKIAKEVSMLLIEAQSLRSQGRLQESFDTISKLLSLDPANESALTVRSQVEGEMAASKSSTDQDAEVKRWLANAEKLFAAGKLAEAKAEADKVARIRPDAPELRALRKKMSARSDEATRLEKDKFETAQKQKKLDDWSSQAEALFKQGKYAEAQGILDQWVSASPQNARAQALQHQTAQALQSLRNFDSAMTARLYDEALKYVAELDKINASDPALADLRKRAEGRKASAKATISVFRLGPPAVITLDDESIGSDGEVDGKGLGIGRHKLAILFGGKQASRTTDFVDGQRDTLVYDSATMELRPMVETDRALLARRKVREQVTSYEVEHRHTFGRCTGTLFISGFKVEYRASDKGHSFERPFGGLKLSVKDKDDKLDMQTSDGRQSWTFKVRNAAQAAEIKELWDKLQKLGK